jgi:hypothetical protein
LIFCCRAASIEAFAYEEDVKATTLVQNINPPFQRRG